MRNAVARAGLPPVHLTQGPTGQAAIGPPRTDESPHRQDSGACGARLCGDPSMGKESHSHHWSGPGDLRHGHDGGDQQHASFGPSGGLVRLKSAGNGGNKGS